MYIKPTNFSLTKINNTQPDSKVTIPFELFNGYFDNVNSLKLSVFATIKYKAYCSKVTESLGEESSNDRDSDHIKTEFLCKIWRNYHKTPIRGSVESNVESLIDEGVPTDIVIDTKELIAQYKYDNSYGNYLGLPDRVTRLPDETFVLLEADTKKRSVWLTYAELASCTTVIEVFIKGMMNSFKASEEWSAKLMHEHIVEFTAKGNVKFGRGDNLRTVGTTFNKCANNSSKVTPAKQPDNKLSAAEEIALLKERIALLEEERVLDKKRIALLEEENTSLKGERVSDKESIASLEERLVFENILVEEIEEYYQAMSMCDEESMTEEEIQRRYEEEYEQVVLDEEYEEDIAAGNMDLIDDDELKRREDAEGEAEAEEERIREKEEEDEINYQMNPNNIHYTKCPYTSRSAKEEEKEKV